MQKIQMERNSFIGELLLDFAINSTNEIEHRRRPKKGGQVSTAPGPWHSSNAPGKHTKREVEFEKKDIINREVFNPSPLPFVTTAGGNVHQTRRQPIARK
jgi:hypothetical protein